MRVLWSSPHCRPDWLDRLGKESQGGQTVVMNRLPHAGVSMTLHHKGELNVNGTKLLEQKSWKVEADRWGRVQKMVETSPRSIQVKDAPAKD